MEVAKRALPLSAPSALGDDEAVALHREIVQHFAGIGVVNHGTDRSRNFDRISVAALAVAALAVAAALGLMFRIEAEMQQRVVVRTGHHHHIAAAAAVAAARTAARDELLAAERKTAVAAVAGFHADFYFVDKQLDLQVSAP